MKPDNLYLELKKQRDILIIFLLFMAYAIYDYLWIARNKLPPGWDDSWHLISSINYYRILTNPGFDMFDKLIHVDWFYPPFFKFSTAFLYMIFGVSIDTAILTNVFYFGILLFSTYGIGKILFNRETGLLAAVIISMYPIIFYFQRQYLLDLALASIVTLSIFLLLLTENFKNLRYSLAFGAVFGMSLLTKWTGLFFIMGPFVCVIYNSFARKKTIEEICVFCGQKISNKISYLNKNFCSIKCKKEWKVTRNKELAGSWFSKNIKIINVTLAGATAAIITSIWYIPNGVGAFKFIVEMDALWSSLLEPPAIFSIKSLSLYALALIPQTSFSLALVFVIGLMYLIRRKPDSSLFLLSWIIFPLAVLTLMPFKQDRYSMPILGAVAIISALWITSISNKKTRVLILSTVILFGGFQVITMASGNNSIHDSFKVYFDNQLGDISLYPRGTALPKQEDWKNEEVMDDIRKDAYDNERIKARGFGYIVVMPDHGYINGRTFEYYTFKKELPFQVYNGAYIGEEMFYANFLNFDYLIIKSGENDGPYKKIVDAEYDYFKKNSNAYLLIKEVGLPDGTMLSVYRNKYMK